MGQIGSIPSRAEIFIPRRIGVGRFLLPVAALIPQF
jgi:hypothetical protein